MRRNANSWAKRRISRREIGRKRGLASARVRADSRLTRELDADTLRHRALDDARGQLLREGTTYSATSDKHWRVIRSVAGRTNQRDVLINGSLWRTCGPRRLPAWLR